MHEVSFQCVVGLICVALFSASAWAAEGDAGATVLKWKDGKKAVFLLAFDDSVPSHLTNAIPALAKRGMVGTFYVNPGTGHFKGQAQKWAAAAKSPAVALGNHTFTHSDEKTAEQLDTELAQAGDAINKLYPDAKQPRLISYGRPGVKEWLVSNEDEARLLAKHHLVDRPPFAGPPFACKTVEEMQKYVDVTIAKGEMGHLDFHGVGGDWLSTPMDYFTALLDKLEASRDQLWVTDAISYHKYATERQTAEVKVVESNPNAVRLQLTSQADPALYDLPLTLSAKVPAEWKECRVTQGATEATVPVADGAVRFDALPGGPEVVLRPATASR